MSTYRKSQKILNFHFKSANYWKMKLPFILQHLIPGKLCLVHVVIQLTNVQETRIGSNKNVFFKLKKEKFILKLQNKSKHLNGRYPKISLQTYFPWPADTPCAGRCWPPRWTPQTGGGHWCTGCGAPPAAPSGGSSRPSSDQREMLQKVRKRESGTSRGAPVELPVKQINTCIRHSGGHLRCSERSLSSTLDDNQLSGTVMNALATQSRSCTGSVTWSGEPRWGLQDACSEITASQHRGLIDAFMSRAAELIILQYSP